jgi:hypothetical protein
VSALQSVLQLPHVVLRLLQQRPQCLGYVWQPQIVGLGHPLPVAIQLTLLQFHVGLQRCSSWAR